MFVAVAALVSCEMDYYRSDTMNAAMFAENPGAAVYSTDGNYSMFKDKLKYLDGMYSGYTYARLYFMMTEMRGDNATLSGRTTDPLYEDYTYTDNPNLLDLTYFWYVSYKIIYGCNSNIGSIKEGVSVETDHLLGENYFLRALCHHNLCNIFATPYTYGELKRPDMPGVVLRTSTDCSVTTRATVGQVYDQIVSDLQTAIRLMEKGKPRGNKGFASYDSARGLLTRVYLYMGENEKCLTLANEMLGDAPAANLDNIETYFANTLTSKETLWCIGKTHTDADYTPKSQLGSMYYSPDGVGSTGWLEIYWSDPLQELIFRHPEDKRLAMHDTVGETDNDYKMLHWPVIDNVNKFRVNENLMRIKNFDMDAEVNTNLIVEVDIWSYKEKKDKKTGEVKLVKDKVIGVKDSLVDHVVYKTTVHGYPVYYMKDLYSDAEDNDGFTGGTKVYVKNNVDVATGIRQTFPVTQMAKFSNQVGADNAADPMLSSPALIRWAEVVLNRAEAYAKLGKDQLALNDVNVIRTRAGIPTWTSMADCNAEGYTNVLDVVLDERRLELCFEGHRAIDVYRNGKDLDRRFAGVQDWEVLDKAALDFKFPYCIPFAETSVNGLTGNGKNY